MSNETYSEAGIGQFKTIFRIVFLHYLHYEFKTLLRACVCLFVYLFFCFVYILAAPLRETKYFLEISSLMTSPVSLDWV